MREGGPLPPFSKSEPTAGGYWDKPVPLIVMAAMSLAIAVAVSTEH